MFEKQLTRLPVTSESENLSAQGQSAPYHYGRFSNHSLSSPKCMADVSTPFDAQRPTSSGSSQTDVREAELPFHNATSFDYSPEHTPPAYDCAHHQNFPWPKENENISSATAVKILSDFYLGSPLFYSSMRKPKVFKPVLLYHKDADKSNVCSSNPHTLESTASVSIETKSVLGFESYGKDCFKRPTLSTTFQSSSFKPTENFVDLNAKNEINTNLHISAFRRPASKVYSSCEPNANVDSGYNRAGAVNRDTHHMDSWLLDKNFFSLENLPTFKDYFSHQRSKDYLPYDVSEYSVRSLSALKDLQMPDLLSSYSYGHIVNIPERFTAAGLASPPSNRQEFYRTSPAFSYDIHSKRYENNMLFSASSGNNHSLLENPQAVTTQQQWLDRPIKVIEDRFICQVCNTECSSSAKLKNHLKVHSGERPHKCDCGRTFARNEELTRHQRIHSGHRPHRCQLCGKTFGRKDHLNKHRTTHLQTSEKKVHACDVPGCLQRYTRSDALARHQWSAHGIKARTSKWRPGST